MANFSKQYIPRLDGFLNLCPQSAKFEYCCWPFQTVWTQMRPYKMLSLIWDPKCLTPDIRFFFNGNDYFFKMFKEKEKYYLAYKELSDPCNMGLRCLQKTRYLIPAHQCNIESLHLIYWCSSSVNCKQAGAKIRSHICGTWSWLQPVCL